MGWLKTIGIVIGEVTKIVLGLGPMITALTPSKKDDQIVAQVGDTLAQVGGIVVTVEAMVAALSQPLPGADKLKMATPMVVQIILRSALMIDKKIDDPALFADGAADITQGVCKVLNSAKAKVETENRLA